MATAIQRTLGYFLDHLLQEPLDSYWGDFETGVQVTSAVHGLSHGGRRGLCA